MKFRRIKMVVVFSLLLVATTAEVSRAQSWFQLGYGASALRTLDIGAMCTDSSNNVYAAGILYDTIVHWNWICNVAKWNAVSHNWSVLGSGSSKLNANSGIYSICTDKYGNLYASGDFTDSTFLGVPVGPSVVAKWDGTNWSRLGTGSHAFSAYGSIKSVCADMDGNIYAGGNFRNSSGRYYVAKWDGTDWSDLGNLNANSYITSVCADDSSNIYAAGYFTNSAGHVNVYKYSVTTGTWAELGGGFDSGTYQLVISRLAIDSQQHVYAALNCSHHGRVSGNVFKWDGTSWRELGALHANHRIRALCLGDSGYVYAAGEFTSTSNKAYVAQYHPATDTWSELGPGTNIFDSHLSYSGGTNIISLCTDNAHHVFAGGSITDSVAPGDIYSCAVAYGNNTLGAYEVTQGSENNVFVYPNPVSDKINIVIDKWSGNATKFFLRDICTGRLFMSGILDHIARNCATIDLTEIPPGEYLLQIDKKLFKIVK